MDNINKLKKLLIDITPVNEKTAKTVDSEIEIISAWENPLNPNLLAFCFDNILDFDVRYRIFEKVNYELTFAYKGTYCYVSHRKMSFNLQISKKYKDELLQLFKDAKKILSDYFLECGKMALEKNDFTMINEQFSYTRKLDFYFKRITDIESKHQEYKVPTDVVQKNEDFLKTFNSVLNSSFEDSAEQEYAIESYVDTYFSYLEHVLTLLNPFKNNFDLKKSFQKEFIANSRNTWANKMNSIAFEPHNIEEIINALREIKEIYRNPNAHGMFTKELKAYVLIKDFGRYPLYLGKNYLKGFLDDFDIKLDYEKFKEIKNLFDNVFITLRVMYEIPMLFIESGLDIPVDTTILTEGVTTREDAELKIDSHHYHMDNQSNMDW